ncbi:MAG: ABC transporter permease [Candidatus Limnocylindrales bacterium]|nr:ABC transporter permease [Candidatus Limnocylindrales bacterium]
MSPRYLAWRLLQVPPAVLGVLIVTFVLIHLAPGDPILALAGEHGDAAYYAEMRAKFGLDRSVPEQLGAFIANLLRLDLGVSYVHGRPAIDVILERVPSTLLLTGSALVVSTILGIGLGLIAATHVRRIPDLAISLTALGLHGTPSFWLAQLALLTLGLWAGWFPVSGMTSPRSNATDIAAALDVARHLFLPMMVLAASEIAAISRLTRVGLLDELTQDYIRTARAKGLTNRQVLIRHALPRALLPVVTVIGGRVGHILAGAVLIEAIFGWPGIGRLLLSSVQTRDTPIVIGIILLIGCGVIIANVVTDLIYARLDPRIRFA